MVRSRLAVELDTVVDNLLLPVDNLLVDNPVEVGHSPNKMHCSLHLADCTLEDDLLVHR